uniref:Enolase 4 n=1 Tax=Oncorhynchus mykiss TaxID=8022 RepID=A0A8K9V840_ONCMY
MSYKGFMNCNSRVSKEEQEFYDLKMKAAEYYRANGVPQKMEGVLNDMFFDKPEDIYGYLANYFSKLSSPPVISRLLGKEIYDGKGQLSLQAQVLCIIKNEEKTTCSAVISSHREVLDNSFQDQSGVTNINNDKRRDSVMAALHWIHESLNTILKGSDPCDQTGVDKILRYASSLELCAQICKKGNSTEKPIPPPEPSELVLPGSMAIGSVSLAVAKTGALLQCLPLYKYIKALRNQQPCPEEMHIPVPLVTLLSCGKMSPGKLNLLEEVIVIPKAGQRLKQIITMVLELQKEMMKIMNAASKTGVRNIAPVLPTVSDSGALVVGYERPEQPLDLITEASNNLGLALGKGIHLAVNCAAHNLMDYPKGKYEVITGTPKSPDELVDMYEALISKYPAVVALIDPLRKEDVEQWERLSSVVGASCSLLSDISSKPQCHSSREDAPSLPGVRGYILNQSNETTVTDLIHVTTENKGAVIIGTTCGEPCSDDALSDVVVGLGVGYVKLGGLSRGERLTKYNRLISIEEELAQQGILGMAFSSLVFSAGRKRRLDKAMGRRGSNGLAGENTSLTARERKLCVRNHEGGGGELAKKNLPWFC